MADYKIKAPDGRIMTIRGPDNATPEQLSAAAQQAFSLPASGGAQASPAPTSPVAEGPSRMEKIGMGMMDAVHGGAQLLSNAPVSLAVGTISPGLARMIPDSVDSAVAGGVNKANNWLAEKTGLVAPIPEGGVEQMVRQREAEYEAQRAASGQTGFDGYRAIGNVISPANLAVASRLPAGATLLSRMGIGAAGGATSAALNPVVGEGDFAEQKQNQVLLGAGAGAALPVAGNVLGRISNPLAAQNPMLQLLKSEGVRPSIGQTLGGVWNTAEQKATAIPFVGDRIAATRGNALRDFNNAAINRAGAPIGESVDGAGSGAVREIGDRLSMAQEAARAKLGNFRLDQQATAELQNINQMAATLPEKEQATFRVLMDTLQKELRQTNGNITPEQFQRLSSKIGADSRQFGSSSDAYQQRLGEAASELQRVLDTAASRSNPQAGAELRAANEGWANLVRVEQAAKAGANNEGVFTPAQLMNAIKTTDQSVRGRAVSRGGALMQDLANAGQTVLGNKVPDSGTAGRMMFSGGLGAAGFAEPLVTGSSLALGSGMYTPPVQNILRAMVSSRGANAAPVANALQNGSTYLSPAAAQALLEGRN